MEEKYSSKTRIAVQKIALSYNSEVKDLQASVRFGTSFQFKDLFPSSQKRRLTEVKFLIASKEINANFLGSFQQQTQHHRRQSHTNVEEWRLLGCYAAWLL
jgi:hypothetical protein